MTNNPNITREENIQALHLAVQQSDIDARNEYDALRDEIRNPAATPDSIGSAYRRMFAAYWERDELRRWLNFHTGVR